MLTEKELQAIESVLVNGKYSEEDLNILATLRHEFRCDNHSLHTLYSLQKGTLSDDKKPAETPIRR